MPEGPLVSVCITNHDYGEFLAACIESALAQTWPHVEVIVVDDGSTDDSLAVAEAFGDRIRLVAKENGGQASAMNAAYAVAAGELVCFVDADDELEPDLLERVAPAFAGRPEVVDVQYLARYVDVAGEPLGGSIPRHAGLLASGDLRRTIARHRSYPAQVGGAHVYRRAALAPAFPLPEPQYRVAADAYMAEVVPLLGELAVVDHVGYRYRMHGRNDSVSVSVGADYFRQKMARIVLTHPHVHRVAAAVGVDGLTTDVLRPLDPAFLSYRLASLRLDPAAHPFPGDRRFRLAVRGLASVVLHPLLGWRSRVVRAGWFVAVALLPTGPARTVIERFTPDVPKSTRAHDRG